MIKPERLKFVYFSFILSLISLPLFAQQSHSFDPGDANYLWPTSASHKLSSTFAETRAGHFHAAFDIKTWGHRGYPVYATRSGILHRIAIGPTGYGKVIYLKHPDGSYSVYAHLLRFADSIRAWTDSVRFQDYTSSIDMVVDSLNIHVEQGQKIGISGASGIGPPHLHFELRTPKEHPFNPMLTNLDIKDTIAPKFSHLGIVPLSITSKINGENQIYSRRAVRHTSHADFGTVNTSGPVGLSVDVFDQSNGVSNAYAVYTLSLQVDGKQVFQSKVNEFSYDETHEMFLDRVYPLLESTGRGYQRLYVADGNTLSFYSTSGDAGHLNLPAGRHQITITARDFHGNERKAELTLNVSNSAPTQGYFSPPDLGYRAGPVDPDQWSWFNDWVNIPNHDFRRLTLAPLLQSPVNPTYYENNGSISVNLKGSSQFYFRSSATNHFVARRAYPKRITYLATPDAQTYASFPAGTFYDTTSVAITRHDFAADSIEINIFPDQPIAKSYKLVMQADSAPLADTTLALYKTYPGSSYLRRIPTTKSGDHLTGEPSSFGHFLLLSDRTSPTVRRAWLSRSPDGFWLIYIRAWDHRSGIDYKAARIYVNGVRGLTEYEPEDGRLVYYNPHFKPKSVNHVKAVIYDNIGNKTVQTFTVSR